MQKGKLLTGLLFISFVAQACQPFAKEPEGPCGLGALRVEPSAYIVKSPGDRWYPYMREGIVIGGEDVVYDSAFAIVLAQLPYHFVETNGWPEGVWKEADNYPGSATLIVRDGNEVVYDAARGIPNTTKPKEYCYEGKINDPSFKVFERNQLRTKEGE